MSNERHEHVGTSADRGDGGGQLFVPWRQSVANVGRNVAGAVLIGGLMTALIVLHTYSRRDRDLQRLQHSVRPLLEAVRQYRQEEGLGPVSIKVLCDRELISAGPEGESGSMWYGWELSASPGGVCVVERSLGTDGALRCLVNGAGRSMWLYRVDDTSDWLPLEPPQ